MLRFPNLIALGSGALAACGFAPLGLWPLTLAGLAVLIWLTHGAARGRSAFARGWWWGLGHFALGLNWIAHAFTFQSFMPHWGGYVAVVLLSLYLAVYPGLAAWLAWRVGGPMAGRGRFTLAFAAAWIATEYLRATLFTGFAWNPLGVVMIDTPARTYATLIGTYGLTGLIACVAGWFWWLAAWADAATKGRRGRDTAHVLAVAASLVALFALYFGVPLTIGAGMSLAVRDIGAAVRIVQPNLSLAEQRDSDADVKNVAILERLTGPATTSPRLILWPEGAVPYYLAEEPWARKRLALMLASRDVLMTGGSTLLYGKDGRLSAARNSVFALDARGTIVARYDKTHLVPYGEYLPARPVLSALGLSRLVESEIDFTPGDGSLTTTIPGFGDVGVQLCYEIIFSGQVTDRARRPAFIFNPSIDAWFGAWGPPQHLAQARLRALEEGLPVVRSTTTGISAVIDANGQVVAALPLNRAGFLSTRLPSPRPPTPFARYGNALPLGLALLLAILAVAPSWRRR